MTEKAGKLDPLRPVRADYRIMKKILDASSMRVTHLPEEFDLVIAVFGRAGGNWEALFDGDIEQLRLLKKTLRVAYNNDYLTRAPKW